jgi:hypothetical protein
LDEIHHTVKHIYKGFTPDINMTSSNWSDIVKKAKDAVLALREQHLPVNNSMPFKYQYFNDVTVQDISFFKKNLKLRNKKTKISLKKYSESLC